MNTLRLDLMPSQGLVSRGESAAAEWRFPNRATPPGSSAYYSVRMAPADLRDDLAALLAWRHQVRATLDDVSDPGVARVKLHWWREELGRTWTGEPRHPLSRLLAPMIPRYGLPMQTFLRMADQAEVDFAGHPPEDQQALDEACEADLGALFELLARCHGVGDLGTLAAARGLGAFCGLVYLIRDSGRHLRRRRPFLPADRLGNLGLTQGSLTLPEHAEQLPKLLAETVAAARTCRERNVTGPRLPAALRVRGQILADLLKALEAEGFDLAERRVGLTPLRKLWLAWREARRGP